MIAFSAILEGPNPQKLADAISPFYNYFLGMLFSEPTLSVKQTTAYTLMKMSEFVPQVIFDSQVNLEYFINTLKGGLGFHPQISFTMVNAFKNLFKLSF